MPNILPIEKVRAVLAAFNAGSSVRGAAVLSGVAINTASRYRQEWLKGGSPEEVSARVEESFRQRGSPSTGPKVSVNKSGTRIGR